MDSRDVDETLENKLFKYNLFCKNLQEGDILYNLDNTNSWGEFFLVATKAAITIGKLKTWCLLLIGMKEKDKQFVPSNTRVHLTPDKSDNTAYLKKVGYCKFEFSVTILNDKVNRGLVVVYQETDLWKYAHKIQAKKPKKRKYERDGKPVVKPAGND